ncbi:hypothetical protein HK100_000722 [Physocladia obscura]|uniref:Uncharacterized protein n=1 Tax=Physocladia obscura TaxID=109957 RepID=A0AAD5XBL9_9FUNG|nr:hypothetical protein HK100_000722 [Physocladia obscura]
MPHLKKKHKPSKSRSRTRAGNSSGFAVSNSPPVRSHHFPVVVTKPLSIAAEPRHQLPEQQRHGRRVTPASHEKRLLDKHGRTRRVDADAASLVAFAVPHGGVHREAHVAIQRQRPVSPSQRLDCSNKPLVPDAQLVFPLFPLAFTIQICFRFLKFACGKRQHSNAAKSTPPRRFVGIVTSSWHAVIELSQEKLAKWITKTLNEIGVATNQFEVATNQFEVAQ